ncbi:GGDEF domain-containing protein [Pelagibacterium sp. H642]|uniref:GGDEF domain-containing protein n=1 Tax=Pelagibacterium sp. H642 TaxID=1881069 RepID=UPI002815CF3C|nr:GGDEF domain-containing protein [Pelagibacterium sp. H642]WMT91204.1 GGDEF domain-containing protein [Pelagibacterium sp. H642]
MQLDFVTLYVIILLNSASFAVVWLLFAYKHPSIKAARYWLAGLLMSCCSGPLLFLGGAGGLANMGLALVAGSFAIMWQGLEVFYGRRFSAAVVGAVLATTWAALAAFGYSQITINIIAAISQIVPLAMAVATLWRHGRGSAGASVAIAAPAIAILGQSGEAVSNTLRLFGLLSTDSYYDFAAWFLVCAIIGGSIWHLGFLLMVVDQMRSNLIKLATSDDLTGLPNRRGLREKMLICEKSARHTNTGAVLMMIDLDKFKSINDRYGHAAGDAALIHIANLTRDLLRADDILARLGGDEFCALLPDIDRSEAVRIAQRFTDTLAATPLKWKGRDVPVSASVGITEWRPGGRLSLPESLERADERMFGIKRSNHAALALSA